MGIKERKEKITEKIIMTMQGGQKSHLELCETLNVQLK